MSHIQEEQKRLYKRAEENDIKLLQEENNRLNNIIDELVEKNTIIENIAEKRMQTIIKIEKYLIDSGIDDDILKCCDIYDVNGVELRKYIEELKGDNK